MIDSLLELRNLIGHFPRAIVDGLITERDVALIALPHSCRWLLAGLRHAAREKPAARVRERSRVVLGQFTVDYLY